ncbi:hypothetical protein ACQ86N_26980 [Puia sp. P3]|uniref:hypothetical protein n=1 Tax=Puia sp. P3 TaxID=3423952 RepID=UPI003D67E11A
MKKLQIVILVAIAISIAVLISFMTDLTTYETIASARQKSGKTVTIIAHLDNSQPIEYNPAKDPNFVSFHISDTLGNKAKAGIPFREALRPGEGRAYHTEGEDVG